MPTTPSLLPPLLLLSLFVVNGAPLPHAVDAAVRALCDAGVDLSPTFTPTRRAVNQVAASYHAWRPGDLRGAAVGSFDRARAVHAAWEADAERRRGGNVTFTAAVRALCDGPVDDQGVLDVLAAYRSLPAVKPPHALSLAHAKSALGRPGFVWEPPLRQACVGCHGSAAILESVLHVPALNGPHRVCVSVFPGLSTASGVVLPCCSHPQHGLFGESASTGGSHTVPVSFFFHAAWRGPALVLACAVAPNATVVSIMAHDEVSIREPPVAAPAPVLTVDPPSVAWERRQLKVRVGVDDSLSPPWQWVCTCIVAPFGMPVLASVSCLDGGGVLLLAIPSMPGRIKVLTGHADFVGGVFWAQPLASTVLHPPDAIGMSTWRAPVAPWRRKRAQPPSSPCAALDLTRAALHTGWPVLWAPNDPTGAWSFVGWRPPRETCSVPLPAASARQAQACLAGKHLLMVGDSLTRYQGFALMYGLTHGEWLPPVNDIGTPHVLHVRSSPDNWEEFLGKEFGGRLRNLTPYVNAGAGVVSFMDADTSTYVTLALYWSDAETLDGATAYVLDRLAANGLPPPTHVALNAGLFATNMPYLYDATRASELQAMMARVADLTPGAAPIWQTTTPYSFPDARPWNRPCALCLPYDTAVRLGWSVVDRGGLVRAAMQAGAAKSAVFYHDDVHVQSWLNTAFNSLLLEAVCPHHTPAVR